MTDFGTERRREFAACLARISTTTELHQMDAHGREAVIDACTFGFPGVWAPKITKVAALYRPRSVPVLDGHVALAFGFDREGFTAARPQRSLACRERIARVVEALARGVASHQSELKELRALIEPTVPNSS